MPRCTRKGCGQDFDVSDNSADSCVHHTGTPVFHEGLKSWSCCADVNKPVLEFDEFMKIPGCATGNHSNEAPAVEVPKSNANVNLKMTGSDSGKEVYTSGPTASTLATSGNAALSMAVQPEPIVEEEDDISIAVNPGTLCRRKGCGIAFESNEAHRVGDGEGTVCVYHPAPPIFREGSKGYLCCKRRVLEFDEFLKIKGCKTGRHVFAPKASDTPTEENIDCRVDHYQTPSEVYVSVFAKKVDQERSKIIFEETQVHCDLHLPGSKRFQKTIDLFGPIDTSASSYKFFGTKVELILKKKDTRSWTLLEKTTRDLAGISLTFGVGGRTGTIGAKEPILDNSSNQ